jgi:hypothetical protein
MLFGETAFGEGVAPEVLQAFRFEGDPLRGGDIVVYHDALRTAREKTLEDFVSVDDDWLDQPRTFAGHPANRHFYWLHLLQDEARHTGQIVLMRKYLLPNPNPDFAAYQFP